MTANGWFQLSFFFLVLLVITKPLGIFLARVYSGQKTFMDVILRPCERAVYRLTSVDEKYEMPWTEYASCMLLFSGVSLALLYIIERVQKWLPLNPQKFASVPPALAWNTAVSFTTNTNWQAYVPETTMSYLTQMAGLAYHNFISAAVGIALAIALIRGIARHETEKLGNFWVDMTRTLLWVLLPLCLVVAMIFVSQGVVQNFNPYLTAQLVESQKITSTAPDGRIATQVISGQTIPGGPVASQEAIKELGTNGGGFFNANSAHPFENPTPFANFLQMVLIFAIPSALTYTLGRVTGSQRHGWAVWGAMAALFIIALTAAYWAEARGNPLLTSSHHFVDQRAISVPIGASQSGGNMEGKEVRFGIAGSALFATVTTDASCGAVNSIHDSFTPLGGMVTLVNILTGEVVFGGVGAGLYGIIVFVVLTVFLTGLMVGRTPEYLGKKIEAYDVKMAMLSLLIFPVTVLCFSAIAVISRAGLAGVTNPGPHGLSQILYAYTSATGNNGSAFAGINADTKWYNGSLGVAMLVGRFLVVIPILAIAGNLARKKHLAQSAGTFSVATPLFSALLASTIVIVGALTFFPALSLGPILEHLLMQAGKSF